MLCSRTVKKVKVGTSKQACKNTSKVQINSHNVVGCHFDVSIADILSQWTVFQPDRIWHQSSDNRAAGDLVVKPVYGWLLIIFTIKWLLLLCATPIEYLPSHRTSPTFGQQATKFYHLVTEEHVWIRAIWDRIPPPRRIWSSLYPESGKVTFVVKFSQRSDQSVQRYEPNCGKMPYLTMIKNLSKHSCIWIPKWTTSNILSVFLVNGYIHSVAFT